MARDVSFLDSPGLLARHPLGTLIALAVVVLLQGCATGPPLGSLMTSIGPSARASAFRYNSESHQTESLSMPGEPEEPGGFPERRADAFQVVQASSGLEEEDRHPVGAALYLEQARQLLGRLAKTPVTQRSFAPRRLLYWLLREVLEGGERVEYAGLR